MWNILHQYFDKLENQSHDNIKNDQKYCSLGRSFFRIRSGIYRDQTILYQKIYITSWLQPVICTSIIKTSNFKEANTKSLLNYDRLKLYKRLGPFDYLSFIPIYSSIFFNYDYTNNLTEPGIIHNEQLFLYSNIDDNKLNIDLKYTTYFENRNKLLFLPANINTVKLLKAYSYSNLTSLRFLLMATNYTRDDYITGDPIKGYYDIKTYDDLRRLLISSRYWLEK